MLVMKRSFFAWLRLQRKRFGRIGDLARDVAQDRRDGWKGRTIESLIRRLGELDACDGAVDTVGIAVAEWVRFRGENVIRDEAS